MAVVAKFRVHGVKHNFWSNTPKPDSVEVTMQPVYGDSPENKEFFAATPSGQIQVLIKNDLASEQFKPGQTYYVTFTPEEAEPPK